MKKEFPLTKFIGESHSVFRPELRRFGWLIVEIALYSTILQGIIEWFLTITN